MDSNRVVLRCAAATGCFLTASAAQANAGVPMLFITMPAMLIALVPIIALESLLLSKFLRTRALDQVKSATIANFASTTVGLPVTWALLVALQMLTGGGSSHSITTPGQKLLAVTWQAPWLIPYESALHWMIPAAAFVLLIPFFCASYLIEAAIIVRRNEDDVKHRVRTAVFKANLVSYTLLGVLTLGWLARSIYRGSD